MRFLIFIPFSLFSILFSPAQSYTQQDHSKIKTPIINDKPASSDSKNLGIVTAGFTAPDEVCINAPIQITNTSVGASSYFWTFCEANFNTAPDALNLGNPGGQLNGPVLVDIAQDPL